EYGIYLGLLTAFSLAPWAVARGLARWRGEVPRPGALREVGTLARSLPAVLVVLIAYTNLKSRLFVLHPTLYDAELARLDAIVHFGGGDFLGWILSTTADPRFMHGLALVYFYAWLGLALPFSAAFLRGGGDAARRVLAALALLYAVGGLAYLALPALGPAFFERERFAHLAGGLAWNVQESMRAALMAIAADPARPAVPFFGIAAFPSLHLGTTALGLFAAWRWSRPLFWLLVPFNLAIAWSALAWGWHYAVDFYPGVLLAWGAWWASGRLLRREPRGGGPAAVAP
ncbi:MAG TPA: phosphatase PAP2 family protein, partial [Thermoanaerobaculia bacterium]|nr:phosphatase PAP2 family protein [Thermoanaerobaculia bacterium]